jgi:hypothetical protein
MHSKILEKLDGAKKKADYPKEMAAKCTPSKFHFVFYLKFLPGCFQDY